LAKNNPKAPFKVPETYFIKHLGIQISMLEPGRTAVDIKIKPQHLNFAGTVHGGFLMTLLDTLMGHAVFTHLGDPAIRFATSSMTTHFLEAVRKGNLTGEGRVIRKGELYLVTEGELRNGEGRLAATAEAVFTFMRSER